jgi:tetratricopeptide (TPR) repeat protein
MNYQRKTRIIANSYYNVGLERARFRDLTGAAQCLKKSLHFNKYMTDARNLLGLIYYETGEVGDALVQWVISKNLQSEENRAEFYLGELQKKKGGMGSERRLIRRFNQALVYAKNGSDDLAIIQLKKVVESKPNYVKAQLLLSVLCLAREDNQNAGQAIHRVLQIDCNNPKALRYKTMVKKVTPNIKPQREPERKKLKKVLSHRQMEDDDVIIPPSYKEHTKDQAIGNIIAGLLLGAAVIFFLVMPANTRAINARHNQEMLKYNEELSKANQKAENLDNQLKSIKEEKEKAETSLESLTSNSDIVLAQYQTVIEILQYLKNEQITAAVKLYADMQPDLITSESVQKVIGQIQKDIAEKGGPIIESLGDQALRSGDKEKALAYYLKRIGLQADSWDAKYKTAVIYKGLNQKEEANKLFSDIINNSKEEALSVKAKTERGF